MRRSMDHWTLEDVVKQRVLLSSLPKAVAASRADLAARFVPLILSCCTYYKCNVHIYQTSNYLNAILALLSSPSLRVAALHSPARPRPHARLSTALFSFLRIGQQEQRGARARLLSSYDASPRLLCRTVLLTSLHRGGKQSLHVFESA